MKKKLFALLAVLVLTLSACSQKEEAQIQMPETTVPVTAPQNSELLTTMETGSGLTLAVLGKETQYSGIGVREIQVYEDETLLQSVLISEAIEKDGVDGIDIGYSQAPDLETAVQLLDVNFDGYPDLQVCGWMPNNAVPYYFWCYDPEARHFDYAFTLQLQRVDTKNRQLVAWYKAENGLYQTETYEVDGQNQLQLIDQQIEDVRPSK